MIPPGAYERFLEQNTVRRWRDETKDRIYDGSGSADVSMSFGQKTAAAASARQALQTAKLLKSFSPNGSNPAADGTEFATHLKSSSPKS